MSAQAEQMKGFVHELVYLVSGSKNSPSSVKQEGTGKKAKPFSIKKLPSLTKKAKGKEAKAHDAKKVSPEEVIPLDDDDLHDF